MSVLPFDSSCFISVAVQILLAIRDLPNLLSSIENGPLRANLLRLTDARDSGKAAVYIPGLRNCLGQRVKYCKGGNSTQMLTELCARIPALAACCQFRMKREKKPRLFLRLKNDMSLDIILERIEVLPTRFLLVALKRSGEGATLEGGQQPYPEEVVAGDKRYRLKATMQRRRARAGNPAHAWSRIFSGKFWFEIDGFKIRKTPAICQETSFLVFEIIF